VLARHLPGGVPEEVNLPMKEGKKNKVALTPVYSIGLPKMQKRVWE
jgi:hypothetical protein